MKSEILQEPLGLFLQHQLPFNQVLICNWQNILAIKTNS
jgi:hypothetical protein